MTRKSSVKRAYQPNASKTYIDLLFLGVALFFVMPVTYNGLLHGISFQPPDGSLNDPAEVTSLIFGVVIYAVELAVIFVASTRIYGRVFRDR